MSEASVAREIDQVDWAGLFHAYDTGEDTRAHLHDLLRGERLDEAVRHLGSAVVHQSTVWPVSPDALRLTCDILLVTALARPVVDEILGVLTEASDVLHLDVDESAELSAEARQAWTDARAETEDTEEALEILFSDTPEAGNEWLVDAALRTRALAPHVLRTLDRLGDGASSEAIEACRAGWLT